MKKCRIAILDSSIDKRLKNNSDIIYYENAEDNSGHGTMCYSIIKTLSSETEFYICKILNDELYTSSEMLIQKLKELIGMNIDIIHLSLSTSSAQFNEELKEVCCNLCESGKIIIAAHDNNKKIKSYPCDFSMVLGVDGGIFESNTDFLYDANKNAQAIANKVPVLTKGKKERYHFFGGTSKAAACMTGIIASHWNMINSNNYETVLSELSRISPRLNSSYIDPDVTSFVDKEIMPYILSDFNERRICESLMKFEKEFQCIVKFEEIFLLDFQNSEKLSKKLTGFIRG